MDRYEVLKRVFLLTSGLLMLAVIYLVFIWVPTEKNLGVSQRIFYIHVPIAWVGFLAFLFVLIGSVGYLLKRSRGWDQLAYSAAEIGVIFTTLMLVTGILWAKPVWGVWWTWDPRLTTTLILWLIYVAYLMLRSYGPKGDKGARYASILGIAGFIDVPIVYLSIYWWRTVHPQALIGPAASGELNSQMFTVFMVSTITFTIFFIYLLMERMSLRKSEDALEDISAYVGRMSFD